MAEPSLFADADAVLTRAGALDQARAVRDLREAFEDYFQNDREGWRRGYGAWRRKARRALGYAD